MNFLRELLLLTQWWKSENTGPGTSEEMSTLSKKLSQLGSQKIVELVKKERPNKQNLNTPPSAVDFLI